MISTKIQNINQIDDFLKAVDSCKGNVYLKSVDGDVFNLKSRFSQYIAIGALLGNAGDYLELFCDKTEDEGYFYKFFVEHPEV